MNKNAAISAMIIANIDKGMDIAAAIDAVFGEGAYIRIVGDLYDELRDRA